MSTSPLSACMQKNGGFEPRGLEAAPGTRTVEVRPGAARWRVEPRWERRTSVLRGSLRPNAFSHSANSCTATERVPAELEEVGADIDGRNPEHALPDLGQPAAPSHRAAPHSRSASALVALLSERRRATRGWGVDPLRRRAGRMPAGSQPVSEPRSSNAGARTDRSARGLAAGALSRRSRTSRPARQRAKVDPTWSAETPAPAHSPAHDRTTAAPCVRDGRMVAGKGAQGMAGANLQQRAVRYLQQRVETSREAYRLPQMPDPIVRRRRLPRE